MGRGVSVGEGVFFVVVISVAVLVGGVGCPTVVACWMGVLGGSCFGAEQKDVSGVLALSTLVARGG